MHICMFTNTYLPFVGGVARSVSFLANDLQKMGHKVLVVAPTFPGKKDHQEEKCVYRVPAIQNFNGSDFSVRIPIPFTLSEKIDRFKPDIIHSHHPFLLGDTALRAARHRKIPLVFTHHTLYEEYTHYVPFDSKPMKKFIINFSTQYANMCSRIIAPSKSIADLIKKRGVYKPIEEVPTGVDLKFFQQGEGQKIRRKLGVSEDTVIIGHLGRLAPEKNLEYLARAVAEFLKTYKNGLFLVVGEGPSQDDMYRIFIQEDLKDRIVFLGKKSGPELSHVYKAMDLFVFSSKSETQGMVLMEALAAGVPIIALDASGSREVVEDRKNGRLLPEFSSSSVFAQAIGEVVVDKNLNREFSDRAQKTAKQFSREICAEKIVNLYSKAKAVFPPEEVKKSSEEIISWNTLLRAMKVEWELLTKKTNAAVTAVKSSDQMDNNK